MSYVPDFSWYNPSQATIGGVPQIAGMPKTQNLAVPDFSGGGGGMSFMQGAQLGLGGLDTLAKLWMGFQANKLARDQFNFTKRTTETNLANQMKSYNTALEDRIRSRAHVEGRGAGYADGYLSKHKLRETP